MNRDSPGPLFERIPEGKNHRAVCTAPWEKNSENPADYRAMVKDCRTVFLSGKTS